MKHPYLVGAVLASVMSMAMGLPRAAVAAHQPDADLDSLFLRLFRQTEHHPRRRAVGGDRFLHEDVEAFFDGVLEVNPAKRERRRQDDDVALLQAVHRFHRRVEADDERPLAAAASRRDR